LLETERLVLRKPQLEDVDDMVELVADDEVMRWIGGEAGGREAAIESVKRWIARWEESGVGQFAVVFGGRVIGRVGLPVWDGRTWETSSYDKAGPHAVTELGWALVRRQWGHGYAPEAARALRPWAYERGVESLISLINPANVRSIRVAEKLDAVPTDTVEVAGSPAVIWQHPQQLS
jgi:RimJ/RimL family protein N-acetyltransferase